MGILVLFVSSASERIEIGEASTGRVERGLFETNNAKIPIGSYCPLIEKSK